MIPAGGSGEKLVGKLSWETSQPRAFIYELLNELLAFVTRFICHMGHLSFRFWSFSFFFLIFGHQLPGPLIQGTPPFCPRLFLCVTARTVICLPSEKHGILEGERRSRTRFSLHVFGWPRTLKVDDSPRFQRAFCRTWELWGPFHSLVLCPVWLLVLGIMH